jgi:gliding motility associated protien GldN
MKKILFTVFVCGLTLAGLNASAQSAYKKKGGANNPPPATNPAPTPAKNNAAKGNKATQQAGNQATQAAAPATAAQQAAAATLPPPAPAVDTIPLVYDTTGSIQRPEISLRNSFATDRSQNRDRKPLEYEHLREDDNMWSEFIWREIDAREKMNQAFNYPGSDDNGDRRFFAILVNSIQYDSVTAFRDDMFTRPFSNAEILSRINGSLDTLDIPDLENGGIKEKKVYFKPTFSFDSVYTFRIKEQILFDKEASRLFTRIIGIAPIARIVTAGRSEPRLLFWLYYPDLRKTFAKIDVYNPKNFSSRMTWEELFESRYFSSYITKSSANNAKNLDLLQIVGNDRLMRLYEGENIKTRIFSFEQDLWQY